MKKRVEQVTQMKFICDVCNEKYDTEAAALACENRHKEKEAKRKENQKRHEEYLKEEAKKKEFLEKNPPKFKRGDIVRWGGGHYCVMRHYVAGEYGYHNWYVLQLYGWYDERHGEHREDKTTEENLTLVATKEEILKVYGEVMTKLKGYGIHTLNHFRDVVGTVQFTEKHKTGNLDDWDD